MAENANQSLVDAKKRATERKARLGFPPKARAIRLKCLDCMGGSANYVRDCDQILCPLWAYRAHANPREEDLQVAQVDRLGEVEGHRPYLEELRARAEGETRWPWEPHKVKLAEIEKTS